MIEVGEYVRTDIGNILKYEGKIKEYIDDFISISNKQDIEFLGKIVKHSKNIIDLIEKGDYVNGLLVRKGKVANGEEKLLIGNHIVKGVSLEIVDIETILTKEQYLENCYKLEKVEEE